MWRFLAVFCEWIMKGSVRSILIGAGLGLGSAVGSLTIIQSYVTKLIQTSSSISADVLALLALSGVHIALSGIIGAVIYKITISSAKLSLMRKS